ncbi:hypothetical protein ACKW6F_18845 [Bacillus safensis]|uniref:hypothetical protein n=1 Tax=Bacillus safensis TaxID=561879 RepID=UPI003916D582
MTIVQESFYVSNEIEMKIFKGEYKRIGGVVRNNKGEIVKHLKPVNNSRAILQHVLKHKDTYIQVGGLVVAGVKSHFRAKKKEPDAVLKFRESLNGYLEAVRNGRLTMELISDLMKRLDELKSSSDFEKLNIVLSMENLDVLLNRIYEITKKLATDNEIELTYLEKETPPQFTNPIITLERHLETQKYIFEQAS